ncbi:hypothetical protein QJQ45_016762, partial [Haematococcus lacustris]
VALQDHHARTIRIPGGPKTAPSIEPVRCSMNGIWQHTLVMQPQQQLGFKPGAEMTLAQHLGLVARPPPLLTTDEWDKSAL